MNNSVKTALIDELQDIIDTITDLFSDDIPGRTEAEMYSAYDEMLDECYKTINIGSFYASPSDVLKEMAPTDYRCGFSEFLDSYDYHEIQGLFYTGDELEEMVVNVTLTYDEEADTYDEEADTYTLSSTIGNDFDVADNTSTVVVGITDRADDMVEKLIRLL